MSRPFKDPRTGVFYFRKIVPDDLRSLVGKREEKRSLGTKDPKAAKSAYAQIAAEVETRWVELRKGVQTLTHKQAHALAGEIYRLWVEAFENNPGSPETWARVLAEDDYANAANGTGLYIGLTPSQVRVRKLERRYGPILRSVLDKRGLRLDPSSYRRCLEAIAMAMRQASTRLERNALGDYRPDPDADRFPKWEAPQAEPTTVSTTAGAVTLTGLVGGWWKEALAAGLSPKTHQSYSNSMAALVAFLGHDDAHRVSVDDVIRFKDYRLATINPRTGKPISPKTVKDSDLAGLKRVFGWAVANRKLASNPAEGVTLKLGKAVKLRSKGFTDGEALAILTKAAGYQRGHERPKTWAAKRWVPWLCAYTGARVGEMAQLRKQDVRREGEHWVITITPEAGTVKGKEARDVPVHPHLVEMGFPAFVASLEAGHLFLTPDPEGNVTGPLQGLKNRLAEFAREVVSDPNVAPNHAWRHRFKTVGLEAGISERILDAICGHAPRTVGAAYGDVTVKAKANAMARFPPYEG